MGALQTFHWGAIFPDMVERILPFQGSAKCSRHNFVFLEGVKAALQADAAYKDGFYTEQPAKGLRAAARVYAGWGLSQTFYRVEGDLKHMGYASLEDFLVGFWEGWLLSKDANNLLTMLWTWQNGDISNNPIYKGDYKKALAGIKAKAIVMPASTDLYFPPEDSANRGQAHAERRTAGGRNLLGPLRRRPRHQPRRHQGASTRRSRNCSRADHAQPHFHGVNRWPKRLSKSTSRSPLMTTTRSTTAGIPMSRSWSGSSRATTSSSRPWTGPAASSRTTIPPTTCATSICRSCISSPARSASRVPSPAISWWWTCSTSAR